MPKVIVLGGGPAGLGAALGLARRGFAPILIERAGSVGGNAGSFEFGGMRVDYGSHRLHPAADPDTMATLRTLLGPDLLERPRHGRILLKGRWIHFPLRPFDLAFRAPPAFVLGAASDSLRKLGAGRPIQAPESFESLLLRGLGPTVCRDFYFPYARKIWGLEPREISPVQARKRISANSIGRMLRRLLPGGAGEGGRRGRGTFFYPRQGFGQISEALWQAATAEGAEVRLNTSVREVSVHGVSFEVEVDGVGGPQTLGCDHLWSTIPITALAKAMSPPPPPEIRESADGLGHRALVLLYLSLGEDRFTEFDAHYFPSLDLPFTRISEPKNYAGRTDPRGRTVLCVEIPCSTEDPIWSMEESLLVNETMDGLALAGLPIRSPVLETTVRRIPFAYPIYRNGFEVHLRRVEDWVGEHSGILSFGRQGLFAHDNTHHSLFTARAAVLCLGADGHFDQERWDGFRDVFAGHTVED